MAARKRLPPDMYDDIPMEMRKYLRFHGWHFNKKACDFAVSLMRKKNASTGKTEKIEPLTKDQVDSMLAKYGVTLENNVDYDYVYVANSFAHEVDHHVEKHIAKTLNFSPYSESASYLVGEIIRNMFYNITRKMLC